MQTSPFSAYIAVNSYRSETSHGFSNTWRIYRCEPSVRNTILRRGLPAQDVCRASDRGPVFSTMGIRAATAAERRKVRRIERDAPYCGPEVIGLPNYDA